ncbi:YceD family protein [Microbacterium oleivorans]|uniref:YceD family protein n=1 Tax=Microbacterium oleivorans TaxID=273677 RepID=UPI000975DAD5|nr:YceD family protein [Microbacterium oleivorans]
MSGPFVLPVRDILRAPGEMREFELTVPTPEKWGEGLAWVDKGSDVEVDVRLESVHEGILVTAETVTTYEAQCSRCLVDLTHPLEVEFQELFGYSGDEATDFQVQDDHVDLETGIRDAIVLSLPFQPVCQPDCPGLDPSTGERLTGAAVQETQIDPRWTALAALSAQTPDHDGEAIRPAADDTEKS